MSKQLTGRVNAICGKTVFLNIDGDMSLFVPLRKFKEAPVKKDIITFSYDEMEEQTDDDGVLQGYLVAPSFKYMHTKKIESTWEVDDSLPSSRGHGHEAPFEVE